MENDRGPPYHSDDHSLNVVMERTSLWRAFHEICRMSLFRQSEEQYHPEHLDSYYPQPASRTELLLSFKGAAIGTIAIDDFRNGKAALRMVAIHPEHQRSGHGRMLLQLTEKFAAEQGVQQLCVNANPEATGFYRALGFTEGVWSEKERTDCSTESPLSPVVQMFKPLRYGTVS